MEDFDQTNHLSSHDSGHSEHSSHTEHSGRAEHSSHSEHSDHRKLDDQFEIIDRLQGAASSHNPKYSPDHTNDSEEIEPEENPDVLSEDEYENVDLDYQEDQQRRVN